MMEIFAAEIGEINLMKEYNDLYSLLSPERKQQIHTCFNSKKKIIETLAGEKLARQILIKQFNCDPEKILTGLQTFYHRQMIWS
jgi:hypothetical protein